VDPRSKGLTTRAALLGLVVCGLVVSAALPLREYLSQSGRIAAAEAQNAEQQRRVTALEQQLQQWQDPAYVRAQARARLHFVMPGEYAYVVLAPSADKGTASTPGAPAAVPGTVAVGPESPWYSQLWGSVRAADRPAPAPSPTPTGKPASRSSDGARR
jgi:cell division protein FtsB